VLSDEIMQQIEAVHVKQPNPSPWFLDILNFWIFCNA
jgi:hypothetical protein